MRTNPLLIETIEAILVLTNAPDQAYGERIAEQLINQKLAACVNLQLPCISIYQWHGQLERSTEIPLYIKTSKSRYDAVEQVIRELHPYELPEIIYVKIDGGSNAYLQWLSQNLY